VPFVVIGAEPQHENASDPGPNGRDPSQAVSSTFDHSDTLQHSVDRGSHIAPRLVRTNLKSACRIEPFRNGLISPQRKRGRRMGVGPKIAPVRSKSPKLVMIFAPKGGVGKTTIALNLAVAAAVAGHRVAGVDFDPQHHFALWATDREGREDRASFAKVLVKRGILRHWREQLRDMHDYDLIFIDTPPRAEAEGNVRLDLQEMGLQADFIIMPVEVSGSAMRFVVQFMSWWESSPGSAVFVLNKTIAGRTILREARETLRSFGPCWEGSIPMRDDITRQVDYGLAAMDGGDFQGRDSYLALWRFCAEKLGVKP